MKARARFVLFTGLALAALAAYLWQYKSDPSRHPVTAATLGASINGEIMEQQIEQPGPIELETINAADWAVPLSGLVNLNRPAAAALQDHDEPIQIYLHVIRHPQFGTFFVDSGGSRAVVTTQQNSYLNAVIQYAMHIDKARVHTDTKSVIETLATPLQGVFFTHLHLDHIFGMPDIANTVPLYVGMHETEGKSLQNLATQGTTDQLLEGHGSLQAWQFQPDATQRFAGVIDIFGDGSLFAISAPGHTEGSTAYLARTVHGPVLLTGDVCHTRWGWEHGVEPGEFTRDHDRNLTSLNQLKALVARHPTIEVRVGHQR